MAQPVLAVLAVVQGHMVVQYTQVEMALLGKEMQVVPMLLQQLLVNHLIHQAAAAGLAQLVKLAYQPLNRALAVRV